MGFLGVLLSVDGRAAEPPALTASTAPLFVSSEKLLEEKKNHPYYLLQGSVGKKGDGLHYFPVECGAKQNKSWYNLHKNTPYEH